jgi:hypothetical protein
VTDQGPAAALVSLLREAARAHHQAYSHTDGEDPEWPLWYAGYLQEPLGTLLNADFTRSELAYLLVAADKEHKASDPDGDWAAFYARFFLGRRQE